MNRFACGSYTACVRSCVSTDAPTGETSPQASICIVRRGAIEVSESLYIHGRIAVSTSGNVTRSNYEI